MKNTPIREGLSFRFNRAIARYPCRTIADGLREFDRGRPDLEVYLREHALYVSAIEGAGLITDVLPPLEDFPDSVFVEDTALCLPDGIIILNPGAPSRRGEAAMMAADCETKGLGTYPLRGPGRIDGGDILVTDREVLVGASARTDNAGFEALRERLDQWGYAARLIRTPAGVLHLKSDCAVLGPETLLSTKRLAAHSCFEGYEVLQVPAGEEAAANAIRVNDTVLVAEGFPATAEILTSAGYAVQTLPASQAALLDGGLSCQSLRFEISG